VPVARINDPRRLHASLSLERERSAILSAFLGSFGPGDGAWAWRAGGATNISFVVHLTRSPLSPILFGYGPPAGTENLLAAALPELPARLRVHFPVADRGALERVFSLEVSPHTVFTLVRGERGLEDAADRLGVKPARAGSAGEDGGPAVVVSTEHRSAFLGTIESAGAASAPAVAARLVALSRGLFDEGIETIGAVAGDGDGHTVALLGSLGFVVQGHVLIGEGVLRGARAAAGTAHPT
jgi:hypothetical protein